MKQRIVNMLALAVVVGFSTTALSDETVSNDVTNVVGLSAAVSVQTGATTYDAALSTLDISLASENEPPDGFGGGDGEPPDGTGGGDGEPPDGTGGGDGEPPDGTGGGDGEPPDGTGGTGGGSDDTTVLTGVYQLDSGTDTLDGGDNGVTLSSTTSDENVILVQSNATLTVSHYTLNKSGDTSSEDNSNFYALNAVVAAKSAGKIYLDNITLDSNAGGANCLFASGSGSAIYAYNCALNSTKGSSRGLDATYEGTVIGSKLTIDTQGDHCAALATDRGNGYISATDSTLNTAGQGSPLIYSTGVIEANCVTGTSTGAQIAGIEGLSTIRIKNAELSGSEKHASEPVANGVIIYQSNSGDSSDGTATFEVSDSTLHSVITNGAMFYVTHSEAVITVQNTVLDFDTDKNCLLKAAGNDGSNGWGTAGANGGGVVLTAINQTLKGNISVDGISSNDLYLVNSTYTGTIVNDTTTYEGNGGANVFIDSNSTWTVTADCTLKNLTVAERATIQDASGNKVTIADSTGTRVSGTSGLKITVSSYTVGDFVATNITDFAIDRTAFDTLYGTSSSGEGGSGSGSGSGGATDHNNWTNYFKPYPPENAIVKIKIEGASDYGVPDRDHKYCLDGYWDGTAEPGVVVHLLYVTTEGYLFSGGCTSNTWDVTITNNAQDVYPPADVVALKAQAKSGRTYYLTLKEAIEKSSGGGKGGPKITLNDDVTLTETLTVTNAITLDLDGTNVVTLGCNLAPAFLFTANATITNGTITSSFAASVEENVLLRFAAGKSTLSDVTLNADGYLLYVDAGAKVTVTNGCAFTCNNAAAVQSDGTLTIAADTHKGDGVVLAAPDGYYWSNGELVVGALSEDVASVAAGTTTNSYGDAQAATNAAVAINENKASSIAVPEGVAGAAKTTYLTKVEATVTSDNGVIVDLTSEAKAEEQDVLDEAVTNEIAVVALTSTNQTATATISKTTPGLYYWIDGGTDLDAGMDAGTPVLSTDGGAVELSKPNLDTTKGRAFFRISAGVASPVSAKE